MGLYAGAAVLLIVLDIPHWLRSVIGLALLIGLWFNLRRHVLRRGAGAISGIQLDAQNGLSLRLAASDAWYEAAIKSRFVHPWAILLAVRPAGRWLSTNIVLPRDAADAEDFRRLRAALLALPRKPAE